jgi:NADH-quinone oxidoreductase subunit J
MITAFTFYLFSFILTLSGAGVIMSRHPVHSVLFLILAFFNAAGLFILLGAEFIAMLLVIVYVGAVAVLFLFVVMMLDMSFADLRRGAMQYVGIGGILGGVLMVELITLYAAGGFATRTTPVMTGIDSVQNTQALGRVLYTNYILPFQLSGLVLFVAMIGAIVLTHRVRSGVRRQSIAAQNATRERDVLEIRAVKSGQGVENV